MDSEDLNEFADQYKTNHWKVLDLLFSTSLSIGKCSFLEKFVDRYITNKQQV